MKPIEELDKEFQRAHGMRDEGAPENDVLPNHQASAAELLRKLDSDFDLLSPTEFGQQFAGLNQAFSGTAVHSVEEKFAPSDATISNRPVKPAFAYRGIILCLTCVVCIFLLGTLLPKSLGYRLFNVVSDSMEREIPNGSLVIVKHTDPEMIRVGDNITYKRKNGSTITHKVVNIIENCGGSSSKGFETRGTENNISDTFIVLEENVIGVVQAHVKGAGSFSVLLKTLSYLLIETLIFGIAFAVVRKNFRKRTQRFQQQMMSQLQTLIYGKGCNA
jgi:signal peptidase